jgi:glucose 1-dehydrogenase
MVNTIEGKVVLITGAGGRIGLGMAEMFHAAGAHVALGDSNPDTVARAAADLGAERTFSGVVDVRDAISVRDFFAATERALGPVDIVVANAGVFPTLAVLDMEVKEWDRVMEVNLRGTFLTCQAAARSMVAGKRQGKIITISSGAHASARPGGAAYCASKAGIVMFTKTLAMELAEARINVNCIAPGYIQSEGAVPDTEFNRALLKNIPWGRFGTPVDVAEIAVFLGSAAADYVTGEVFAVNGGAFAGRMYLPLNTATAQ